MAKPDVLKETKLCAKGQGFFMATSQGACPVIISPGLLEDRALMSATISADQIFIVSNPSVAALYGGPLQKAFADRQCDLLLLREGEAHKNQESLSEIHKALVEKKHHRDTCILGLGGGVITDIAGFAASIYQRGVDFVPIPTSLLAQIDASIGGKTAINLPNAKNIIGSFHPPKAVLIDPRCLSTLPLPEFRAGLAEVIKYAILEGGAFFDQVEKALEQGLAKNAHRDMPALIQACCQIKAAIVEEDERESGKRALLNLGHTLGHALEAFGTYQRWLHGEAVAIGLYFAALFSHLYYGLKQETLLRIDNLLQLAGLPRRIPKDGDWDALIDLMHMDKKAKNKTLRFIVINALGDCGLVALSLEEEANLKEAFFKAMAE